MRVLFRRVRRQTVSPQPSTGTSPTDKAGTPDAGATRDTPTDRKLGRQLSRQQSESGATRDTPTKRKLTRQQSEAQALKEEQKKTKERKLVQEEKSATGKVSWIKTLSHCKIYRKNVVVQRFFSLDVDSLNI